MDRRTFLKTATETTLATVVPLPVIKFAEEDINSWNLNTKNLDKQVIIQLKIKMIQICGDPTIKVSKLWWVDGEDKKINTITSLEDFEDLYGKAISINNFHFSNQKRISFSCYKNILLTTKHII